VVDTLAGTAIEQAVLRDVALPLRTREFVAVQPISEEDAVLACARAEDARDRAHRAAQRAATTLEATARVRERAARRQQAAYRHKGAG
jgi:hypothetical protein